MTRTNSNYRNITIHFTKLLRIWNGVITAIDSSS